MPTAKDTRALLLNLGIANVMFALAANIAKFIEGDDEDIEDALGKMKDAMVGMNLVYQVPYFGAAAEQAVNAARGEGNKPSSTVVNPFSAITRKISKLKKKAEAEGESKTLQSAVRVLVELSLGVQFDPFIGLANAFSGNMDDDTIYELLGISPSYRPQGKEKKKASKPTKSEMKELYGDDFMDDMNFDDLDGL